MKQNCRDPEKSLDSETGTLCPRSHVAACRFLVLPLGVFVLSSIIFSLTAFGIGELVHQVMPLVRDSVGEHDSFREATARIVWAATVVLFFSTFIAVAIYCYRLVQRTVSGRARLGMAVTGAAIAGLVLAYFFLSGHFRTHFGYLFYFTFDSLKASGRYSSGEILAIRAVLTILNALAGLIPTLALITGCSIMCGGGDAGDTEVEVLERRMRRLKVFTVMGSALLVAGMLHMVAWLSWPAALLEQTEVANRVARFSEALVTFWGTTFSLVLATFYVPAAWNVHRQAAALYEQSSRHAGGEEMHDWLQRHGLSMAPLKQIPQVAAILAPLLTGPIGVLVEGGAASIPGA